MSERPSVSLVVPFAGPTTELERLLEGLSCIALRPGDEVIVADNGPVPRWSQRNEWPPRLQTAGGVKLCRAEGIRSPAFARNHGAAIASGQWLVFIDADTRPAPTLLDDYFDGAVTPGTGILAGAIEDAAERDTLVARHGVIRARMSQQITLGRDGTPYAQTANCAVLREAFEAVGGFDPSARAGEDADLCFRLQRAGWRLEERPGATVVHRSRDSLTGWLAQLARHGAGAAWLNRRWPDEFPPPRPWSVAARLSRVLGAAVRAATRSDREAAAFALLDFAGACAFELGRLGRNRSRRTRPIAARGFREQRGGEG